MSCDSTQGIKMYVFEPPIVCNFSDQNSSKMTYDPKTWQTDHDQNGKLSEACNGRLFLRWQVGGFRITPQFLDDPVMLKPTP